MVPQRGNAYHDGGTRSLGRALCSSRDQRHLISSAKRTWTCTHTCVCIRAAGALPKSWCGLLSHLCTPVPLSMRKPAGM